MVKNIEVGLFISIQFLPFLLKLISRFPERPVRRVPDQKSGINIGPKKSLQVIEIE